MLKVGTLAWAGLSLPSLLAAKSLAANAVANRKTAKSCILLFLEGGPSHLDLWDMKPRASAEIRGEFQPIATSVPGVQVCEHLPLLSRQMHHFAQVRSVHHKVVDHNAGAYYMLTGRSPLKGSRLIVSDEAENFPPFGAVLAKLRPLHTLPPFVHLPDVMSNNGFDLPGQRAGLLGPAFDPLLAGDPSEQGYRVPGLELPRDISSERMIERRDLLARLNEPGGATAESRRLSTFREQAFDLLSSGAARQAFDLSRESRQMCERYGLPDRIDRSVEARKFGGLPHLGQCCLLARRLIEAGVRLVTVCSGRRIDQAWDTHRDHFPLLKRSLLPFADRAFATLLADLDERGLLDETLVVAMGEFGRTPKLGQITSSAGADKAGRDHWPNCYSGMLAGGGIRGGAVYGASDSTGGYPLENAVTPEDVAATIYKALGIDADTRISDQFGRPQSVALGTSIEAVLS